MLSQTERGKSSQVNTHIGVCTCPRGLDGSPCSHQAGVLLHYGDESCNYIATISATARLKLAKLALDKGSVDDPAFYSSIHQKSLEEKYGSEMPAIADSSAGNEVSFQGPEWE